MSRSERLYLLCVTLFCTLLVLTNLIGLKFFQLPFFPDYPLTTGLLTYPLTFLIGDLVTEIWGKERARFMVFAGFAMSFVALFFLTISLHLSPHAHWVAPNNPFGYVTTEEYQTAYASVFGTTFLLFFASLLAYLVAQLTDVSVFAFLKKLTHGRFLGLRGNVAVWIAQALDTLIVNGLVLFVGLHFEWDKGFEIIRNCYVSKVCLALLETPLFYLGVGMVRNALKSAREA